MIALPITGVAAGILGLLLAGLGLATTIARFRTGISLGTDAAGAVRMGQEGSAPRLQVLVRAQANLAEYAPLGLGLLALAEHDLGGAWFTWLLAALLVGGRLLHPIGLGRKAPNPFRAAGAALTYSALIMGGVHAVQRLL
jgi:uncharacterized protein